MITKNEQAIACESEDRLNTLMLRMVGSLKRENGFFMHGALVALS